MEIRHADLQIEVEDAEDGGVLLTIIDSAPLDERGGVWRGVHDHGAVRRDGRA